jgi:hypothetical protein
VKTGVVLVTDLFVAVLDGQLSAEKAAQLSATIVQVLPVWIGFKNELEIKNMFIKHWDPYLLLI